MHFLFGLASSCLPAHLVSLFEETVSFRKRTLRDGLVGFDMLSQRACPVDGVEDKKIVYSSEKRKKMPRIQ